MEREWSKLGEKERSESFDPLLNAVDKFFSVDEGNRFEILVLCPGSGLGRLLFEFIKRGYSSQGNDYSYFMLISADFLINRVQTPEAFPIYPFANDLSN